MANCLAVQSGGPAAVINTSLAGVVHANQLDPVYDHVYGGLSGIEEILGDRLYNLTNMSGYESRSLRQTPSSVLGSCRYKLKRNDETDYHKLIEIIDKHDVETLFYTGGNDSIDTVDALSRWVKANNIGRRFIGIPRTVDSDLMVIDHYPGFASGVKFTSETADATQLDCNVYTREEVFIPGTMGKDTGWLAGSTVVTGRVDLIVLPEVDFDKEKFLAQVKKCMDKKGKCYIATSESAYYANGIHIAADEAINDGFGHAVLGGAGENLKNMVLETDIVPRVKVQDLNTTARSSDFTQSSAGVTEALELGVSTHSKSIDGKFTGHVVTVQREYVDRRYNAKFISEPAENFANHIKHAPIEWILPDYQGLTQEFYDCITPLIQSEPTLIMRNGIPKTIVPFNKR